MRGGKRRNKISALKEVKDSCRLPFPKEFGQKIVKKILGVVQKIALCFVFFHGEPLRYSCTDSIGIFPGTEVEN